MNKLQKLYKLEKEYMERYGKDRVYELTKKGWRNLSFDEKIVLLTKELERKDDTN